MENKLQSFSFKGNEIKVLVIKNQIWFPGNNVACVLGYRVARKAISDHVDKDDKQTLKWRDCSKIEQLKSLWNSGDFTNKVLVNESGLFSLILASKLESAKEFKHWVTSEVLPSIRKTGSYSLSGRLNLDSYRIENPVERAKAWIKEQEYTNQIEDKNRQLNSENNILKPKGEYYDAVSVSEGSILVGNFAKQLAQNGINIGENKLYVWLRKKHYVMSAKGRDRYNLPYQQYINNGWLEIKKRTKRGTEFYEVPIKYFTTLITPKGQIALTNILLKDAKEQCNSN